MLLLSPNPRTVPLSEQSTGVARVDEIFEVRTWDFPELASTVEESMLPSDPRWAISSPGLDSGI